VEQVEAGRGDFSCIDVRSLDRSVTKELKMRLAAQIFKCTSVLMVLSATSALAQPAPNQDPIRIGNVDSYTTFGQFTLPYRKGVELAVKEINAAGGVLGRPIEVLFRDDAGKPDEGLRQAEELVTNQKVVLIEGMFLSSVTLALSDFGVRRHVIIVNGQSVSDAVIWEKGNRYTFHTSATTDMQSRLMAKEAAKLSAKRWATVAPNYEYGTSFVNTFKKHLSALRPDIQWVGEQWPALGKLDAGQVIDALAASKPEAIFNATFGSDLVKFVREGKVRNLFSDRPVVSALTGEPEYLDTLKSDPPVGWIVSGYPWDSIKTPEHVKFVKDYQALFHDDPKVASLQGYLTYKFIAAGLTKAGSTDTEKLITAFEGVEFQTPVGPAKMRAADHQATVPFWVAKVDVRDGSPTLVDVVEGKGEDLLPSEDEAKKLRPAQ
jgi:branched-chain amino acid transport system substrate-binding protein